MPTVSADPTTLPRITRPEGRERPVERVTTAPSGYEGEGFPVKRAFAGVDLADLDPFVHMDQMGAVDYGPGEPRGTDWHPHRGFETVTYIIDGIFQHQDSHGGGGVITNGATQWMTAGGGILHIETPPESLVVSGGLFHGIQLWVNLPSRDKMIPPAYQSLEPDDVVLLASDDAGSLLRVVAGDVDGHCGPGNTHSPITFLHATVSPGETLRLPWDPTHNALVYALGGAGSLGTAQATLASGQLAVLGAGDYMTISADEHQPRAEDKGLEVLVLGGEPIGEPVAHYGPFVMNTRDELAQAMDDYRAGKLGVVPPGALRPYHG
jgi:redox-sensitive bicupin YhaK (pirin superfamily)